MKEPRKPKRFAPDPECERCEDRGHRLRKVDGYSVAAVCECQYPSASPERMREWLGNVGMSPIEIDSAMGKWRSGALGDRVTYPEYPAGLLKWVEMVGAGGDALEASVPRSFMLVGGCGKGKTKALAKAVRHYALRVDYGAIRAHGGVRWWCCRRLGEEAARLNRERDTNSRGLYAGLMSAWLLVLDDLGAEREGAQREWIEGVIDERYRLRRPILVSTNIGSSGDVSAIKSRTVSRLQMGMVRSMGGDDIRPALGEAMEERHGLSA